ncbi:MAG: hypothetical protein ABIO81_05850 [Ginsengibacter sp.]
MKRNLHNIDDLFRSALEGHEEIPSAGVKERLDAALDKKEAKAYKKRSNVWKRATLLLLMLLTGFILYESGIFKKDTGTLNKTSADKKNGSSSSAENNKKNNSNGSSTGNINNDNSASYKSDAIKKVENTTNTVEGNRNLTEPNTQKDTNMPVISGINNVTDSKNLLSKKIAGKKNKFINDQFDLFAIDNKSEVTTIDSNIDKNSNHNLLNNDHLLKEKINSLPSGQPMDTQKEKPTIINSPLKNNTAKKTKEKKRKFFNPFWMITAFASYDRVGYRLDSDQPLAISSIKHREVHEPSFSAGMMATRQFTKHWGLQSGLVYSNIQIGISPQKMYAFQDPAGDIAYKYITSSGYAYIKPGFGQPPAFGDSLTTDDAKHIIENVTVPLSVKYTVAHKKISFTTGAGIEGNFITKANLEVDIENAFNREIVIVKKLKGTKSFYWSFAADAELRYNINKKISVMARPVYRIAISPITKNNIVETFPHSFGIGAGVSIKL